MINTSKFGRKGETLVLKTYLQEGYRLLARNFQYYQTGVKGRLGEIDLIFCKDQLIAMVEVKTRSSLLFGHSFTQVSRKQLANLHRAFVYFQNCFPEYRNYSARFDVASVFQGQVTILKNAYEF